MAQAALEPAMPASWVDEVFEEQRQYLLELMFSTIVELTSTIRSYQSGRLAHPAARPPSPAVARCFAPAHA
ncbi:MAG TPA: hypothetical protein PKL33_08700, partial [Accumulibacter sp.]|nr:hypothetical protein [Accumulibacter sp.]